MEEMKAYLYLVILGGGGASQTSTVREIRLKIEQTQPCMEVKNKLFPRRNGAYFNRDSVQFQSIVQEPLGFIHTGRKKAKYSVPWSLTNVKHHLHLIV